MFAKICGIDLRLAKFADLSIAQTSVAKISAIVTRADIRDPPAFHILADSRCFTNHHPGSMVYKEVITNLRARWTI